MSGPTASWDGGLQPFVLEPGEAIIAHPHGERYAASYGNDGALKRIRGPIPVPVDVIPLAAKANTGRRGREPMTSPRPELDPRWEWIEVPEFGKREPGYVKGRCRHTELVDVHTLRGELIARHCLTCEVTFYHGSAAGSTAHSPVAPRPPARDPRPQRPSRWADLILQQHRQPVIVKAADLIVLAALLAVLAWALL